MRKLLVVVDMQNDFVTGALGTKEAQDIVPRIVDFISNSEGDIVFTMDTHHFNYLESQEGRKLPVTHCVDGTEGWDIVKEVYEASENRYGQRRIFKKNTFGSEAFMSWLMMNMFSEIHFVGVCTGICVISNAVLAKTALPEVPIYIHKDLCACVTPESHERALKSMELLQMDII